MILSLLRNPSNIYSLNKKKTVLEHTDDTHEVIRYSKLSNSYRFHVYYLFRESTALRDNYRSS